MSFTDDEILLLLDLEMEFDPHLDASGSGSPSWSRVWAVVVRVAVGFGAFAPMFTMLHGGHRRRTSCISR